MRKPPRATSATALVTTSPLVPVTASFLCWGAGVGIAEGVGSLYRSITGVGSGTGLRVGVVLGLGVGVADGLGVGVDGVVDGLGVGVTDGLGADGLGLGDADGVGVTDGVGSGVGLVDGVGAGADGLGLGAGVGVPSPSVPPDALISTEDSYLVPFTDAMFVTLLAPAGGTIFSGVYVTHTLASEGAVSLMVLSSTLVALTLMVVFGSQVLPLAQSTSEDRWVLKS